MLDIISHCSKFFTLTTLTVPIIRPLCLTIWNYTMLPSWYGPLSGEFVSMPGCNEIGIGMFIDMASVHTCSVISSTPVAKEFDGRDSLHLITNHHTAVSATSI